MTVKSSPPCARALAVAVLTLPLWSLLPGSGAARAGEPREDAASRDHALRAFFRNFQTRQHVEFIEHIVHPQPPEPASPNAE